MNDAQTHVLLVDDNEQFRESTTWLLEGAGLLVEAFGDAHEVLQRIAAADSLVLSPATCLVSDIRMPGMSGIQLQAELRRRECKLPLIFITGHGDVPLAVSAMRNGASDFIEKPFEADTLVRAIEAALQRTALQDAPAAAFDKLSPRERQVLELVVSAKPNKVIADILDISIKTVELHRAHMMTKLGAHNLQELLRIVFTEQQQADPS